MIINNSFYYSLSFIGLRYLFF
uniref:Uncharacterized protein n=1 Tax=Lepeophtheirus salmonis TaxID=72036 RepID=A0A0K2TKM9_LEPSM